MQPSASRTTSKLPLALFARCQDPCRCSCQLLLSSIEKVAYLVEVAALPIPKIAAQARVPDGEGHRSQIIHHGLHFLRLHHGIRQAVLLDEVCLHARQASFNC